MRSAYYLGKFAATVLTHHHICKYLWKVDTVIHIFQQIEYV